MNMHSVERPGRASTSQRQMCHKKFRGAQGNVHCEKLVFIGTDTVTNKHQVYARRMYIHMNLVAR